MSLTAKDYDNLSDIYINQKALAKEMAISLGGEFEPKNMYSLVIAKEAIIAIKKTPFIQGRRSGKTALIKKLNRIKSIPLPHELNISNILNGSFSVKVLVCGEWLEYKI